ncbi:MAG: MarR family transcriptional regulator, partial [Gemmatimonadetes bacterium]|nr:MarR family transcriptional regulator [Gemmatimonadota bacterium]
MTTVRRAKSSRPGVGREGGLATEVLGFVWRRKAVSRAEIARHTGRSRSTISEVVGRLLPTGLIEE